MQVSKWPEHPQWVGHRFHTQCRWANTILLVLYLRMPLARALKANRVSVCARDESTFKRHSLKRCWCCETESAKTLKEAKSNHEAHPRAQALQKHKSMHIWLCTRIIWLRYESRPMMKQTEQLCCFVFSLKTEAYPLSFYSATGYHLS